MIRCGESSSRSASVRCARVKFGFGYMTPNHAFQPPPRREAPRGPQATLAAVG